NRADFIGISLVGRTPQALCVHPALPVNTIAEFLDYVRDRPDQIFFSSAGIGASSHLATEMLMAIAGLRMLHVPYRGGAPS
ncbi:MAG: tripartite tricarboxylate transporter substrate binding protein, partial [Roseomonas sp.]|nr:tripartite tricarboxylate transporter substrate binding protein [Roseomonas sp.]